MAPSAEMNPLNEGVGLDLVEQPPALPDEEPRPSVLRRTLGGKRSLQQSFIALTDQAVVSATNFLTGVIIARACSKEELGLYALGFTLILMMADLQSSLIMTPYMVYAPRLKGKAHALYTGSTLLHQLGFCVLTMAGLVIGAVAAGRGLGPKGLAGILWALAFVIALIMLREHARRVSFARLQLKTALLFDSSIALGQAAGLLLLAHFHLLSASRAYWMVGLASLIAVAGWLWWDREFYEPRMREAIEDLKRNWILGKWVLASGLLSTLSVNLYPWLLAALRDVQSAGIYAACLGAVSAGNPIMLGLQNLIGPRIAHQSAAHGVESLKRLVLKSTLGSAAPMALFAVVTFRWGGVLLERLYGHQYAGNGIVVSILSVNIVVQAAAFPISRALYAIERADIDFAVNLIAVLIMLTAGLWLVRTYGPPGAAYGMLGANLATSLVRAVIFVKLSNRLSAASPA
jgi:O-antigen/teichoic acid export membrane protein